MRPEVAPGLAHVVDRALARDPADRWPNAAAMRDALTPFRVAAPDRGADATMPVALPRTAPTRPAAVAPAVPDIINDGVSVGTRMLAWIGALILGIVGGYAGYVLATDTTATTTTTPAGTAAKDLPILGITSFDPDGPDQAENDADLGLMTDGRASTAWATDGYFNPTTSPKPGVGFVLDLGEQSKVRELEFTSGVTGWDINIYVGSESPTTLDAWGEPAASATDLGLKASVPIEPSATGRYVLVWFTKLVEESDGRYRGRIVEVSVRGTPG